MQIILFRARKGRAQTLALPPWLLALGAVILVIGLASSAFLALRYFNGELLSRQVVASWQERLEAQRREIDALQSRTGKEMQAVGRRMAGMQARLLRMEALGARLTDVASLDEGEFRFDQPAALGGPDGGESSDPGKRGDGDERREIGAEEALPHASAIDQLARQIRRREDELEVLQSLLRNRRFHERRAPAGRPVERGWMSSAFGRRADPFSGRMAWHSGVDFAGKASSDVIAVGGGVVVYAGEQGGYGKLIEIDHGDGYLTRYAHHEEILVETGEIVQPGDVIARLGASGRSTGPHVHFEVLKDGDPIDPQRYISRSR